MIEQRPDHLLVEGPDGSGKTTLINQLCRDFGYERKPRFATSVGGPFQNLSVLAAREFYENKPGIYDRHPYMSDPIYSEALHRRSQINLKDPFTKSLARLFFDRTPVILCLPPLHVVQANVNADLTNQLEGVGEATPALWHLYRNFPRTFPYLKFTIYDYTQPEAYYRLREFLYNHYDKDTNV